MNGRVLHFYLAGINDENFVMRDRETGTWWQQVSGRAIAGPLRGARLRLLSSEEISFGLWRREYPWGTVLASVTGDRQNYVRAGWVKRYHKYPVVIPVPKGPLHGRTLVVGVEIGGATRAYPFAAVARQGVIQDDLGGTPILIALGPDSRTVRVFARRAPGLAADAEFFKEVAPPRAKAALEPRRATPRPAPPLGLRARSARAAARGRVEAAAATRVGAAGRSGKSASKTGTPFALVPWTLMDAATGSQWDFRGCAVQGPEKGQCLPVLPSLNEDWFDWRHYHPRSEVWSVGLRR